MSQPAHPTRKEVASKSEVHWSLENHIQPYEGRPAVLRLLHILKTTQSYEIRTVVATRVRTEVEKIPDVDLYRKTVNIIDNVCGYQSDFMLSIATRMGETGRARIQASEAVSSVMKLERDFKTGWATQFKLNVKYMEIAEIWASIGHSDIAHRFYKKLNLTSYDWIPEVTAQKWEGILTMFLEAGSVKDSDGDPHVTTIIQQCSTDLRQAERLGDTRGIRPHVDAVLAPIYGLFKVLRGLVSYARGDFSGAATLFIAVGEGNVTKVQAVLVLEDLALLVTLSALASQPTKNIAVGLPNHPVFSALIDKHPFLRALVQSSLEGDVESVLILLSQLEDYINMDVFACLEGQGVAERIALNALERRKAGSVSE